MNKLDKYESMKDYILESLDETVIKLEELKKEGKDKTATYRQLTARKLNLQNVVSFYKMFDIIDSAMKTLFQVRSALRF